MFMPKGEEGTHDYRPALARWLQEQEEARLLPGLRRSDEAVINLPGRGKTTGMPLSTAIYGVFVWMERGAVSFIPGRKMSR